MRNLFLKVNGFLLFLLISQNILAQKIYLQKWLEKQLVKIIGVEAPLELDQEHSFNSSGQAPQNFNPIPLKTVNDFERTLLPGDYSCTVIFYCTQWSIHRPGQGTPYKLGRTQGKMAKQISALLYKGTIKNVAPNKLNACAWRIQTGTPLGQWSQDDQLIVHQLIPMYEKDLQGDFIQKIQDDYNNKKRDAEAIPFLNLHPPTFENVIVNIKGKLGDDIRNIMRARNILQKYAYTDDELPQQLFQPAFPGDPMELPADTKSPSPWMQVNTSVIARFTNQNGNLKNNLLELRVLPGAEQNSSITLDKIINGEDTSQPNSLMGYPIGKAAQIPIIEPKPDPCENTDPCQNIAKEDIPIAGDVIIYWQGGVIVHSGVVKIVDKGCKVETFESYIDGLHAVVTRSTDDKDVTDRYGTTWTIYRTNRPAKNRINIVPAKYPGYFYDELNQKLMGQTDKGTNIVFHKTARNCHGFTFVSGSPIYLIGYMLPNSNPQYNNDSPDFSQSSAVKHILIENKYRQIHSTGGQTSCDRFNSDYNVSDNLFNLK